ncbi:MAG TPA: FAD-dependent oxidoreductase, partial [Thermoanaerobaculia bacterium]|nr:FAD-dependent oxidoreductase [Thermoanaerobaculia bacterium]
HAWRGIPIDVGATWLNRASTNPLLALARDLRVRTTPADYDAPSHVYDAAGHEMLPRAWAAVRRRTELLVDQLVADADAFGPGTSLGAALEATFARQTWTPEMEHNVRHYLHATIEQEYATDVEDMCLAEWYDFADFGEGDRLFPGGFDELPRKLARGLDVELEHVITRVEHDERGVRIITNRTTFEGDVAILTLPLGVLQSGSIEFVPPLPPAKSDALRGLGMGVLNKLAMRFRSRFWPAASEWLEYAGETTGRWALFFNLYKHLREPVLIAFNSGAYARALEDEPDEHWVDEAMAVLRTMFGRRAQEPEDYLVTRWASDPFARGSYSYISACGRGADMDALAEPIGDRLYFAGEATSRAQYGTVQGAFLSGFRAAGEIAVPESAQLVASLSSELYHYAACIDALRISPANRIRGLFARHARRLHPGCPRKLSRYG